MLDDVIALQFRDPGTEVQKACAGWRGPPRTTGVPAFAMTEPGVGSTWPRSRPRPGATGDELDRCGPAGRFAKNGGGAIAGQPTEAQQSRRDEGPLTLRGIQTKRALLEAARRVFERKGFVDTRVSDLVREAGVSHGTFYVYFDTKEAIFSAVAQAAVDEMLASMGGVVPGEDLHGRVRDSVRRYVEAYRPHARIISLIEQGGMYSAELRQLRLDVRDAFVERTQRGIVRMQEVGKADPRVDVEYTAEVLGAMLEYTCYLWFTLEKPFADDRLIDALAGVWERAMGSATEAEPRARRGISHNP